jgi:hypothetical protein
VADRCEAVVSDGAVLVRAVLPLLPQQLPPPHAAPPGTVLELASYEWEWDQFAGREEMEREAAQARPWSRVLDAPAELFLVVRDCSVVFSEGAAALGGAERLLAFSAPALHPRHRVSMAVRAMCAGSMVLSAWRPHHADWRPAAKQRESLEGDRPESQEQPGWDEELVGPAQTLALRAPRERECAEAGTQAEMRAAALPGPPPQAALLPGSESPPQPEQHRLQEQLQQHRQHQRLCDGKPGLPDAPSPVSCKRCSQPGDEAVTADLEEQLALAMAERSLHVETCAQLRAKCCEYELASSRLSAGKQAAESALAAALACKQAADEALAAALADKAELATRCSQLAESLESAVTAAREEGEHEGWKAVEELNEVRDRYKAALVAATAAAAASSTSTSTRASLADERQWKRDLAAKDQKLAVKEKELVLKEQQLARAEEALSKLRYSFDRVCAREADARKEISRLLDEDRVRVEVERELEARNAQIKKLQLRLQKKCEALRQAEAQAGRRPRQPEDDDEEEERARKLPTNAPPTSAAPARGAPPAPEEAAKNPSLLNVGNLGAYWAARLRE